MSIPAPLWSKSSSLSRCPFPNLTQNIAGNFGQVAWTLSVSHWQLKELWARCDMKKVSEMIWSGLVKNWFCDTNKNLTGRLGRLPNSKLSISNRVKNTWKFSQIKKASFIEFIPIPIASKREEICFTNRLFDFEWNLNRRRWQWTSKLVSSV